MLLSLRIQDFALVDQLELEFGPGLNVLTGETGAGKSIILDAIDAVLGGKASSRAIRTGCRRAAIEATFAIDAAASDWLRAQEIDLLDEGNAICSREIVNSGNSLRSRLRINGVLVNRKQLGQLRQHLVEIAAQGQTVELARASRQRDLLDAYGGCDLQGARDRVAAAYKACKAAEQALEKRRQSEQERWQRLDWLKFQLQELEAAQLSDPDELAQVEQEQERLAHTVELQNQSFQVYQALYQNESGSAPAAADLLGAAASVLHDMVRYDSELQGVLEMVQVAIANVSEAGQRIRRYGDQLESDPERLAEVEERVRVLKQICRKYGPDLSDAIAHYKNLQAELAELTDDSQSLDALEQIHAERQAVLLAACRDLTQLRRCAATELECELVKALKPLAMAKVRFECRLEASAPTAAGADRVVFYFSPNPGEPVQPLVETASGGEMSRFLLALKTCFSQAESSGSPQTLIFDEIDTGVSGKVAQAIASQLHRLSRRHQVLCVTHQPLVAAMADHHFRVDKQASAGSNGRSSSDAETRTVVRVTSLHEAETRTAELAQLAGGHSADEARAFAESLLAQAAAQRGRG